MSDRPKSPRWTVYVLEPAGNKSIDVRAADAYHAARRGFEQLALVGELEMHSSSPGEYVVRVRDAAGLGSKWRISASMTVTIGDCEEIAPTEA